LNRKTLKFRKCPKTGQLNRLHNPLTYKACHKTEKASSILASPFNPLAYKACPVLGQASSSKDSKGVVVLTIPSFGGYTSSRLVIQEAETQGFEQNAQSLHNRPKNLFFQIFQTSNCLTSYMIAALFK
jgi:hypothetical protein